MRLLEEAFDLESAMVWAQSLDRLRNNCIFGIAKETGARISEILALQVGDIGVGSVSVIHLVKRANNINDSRRDKPRAKTFGRTLPISKSLHARIVNYIQQRPRKQRNVYLFLSHDGETTGKPLSLRRAHALMEDVARVYSSDPRLGLNPTWHDIRHTALYRFYQHVNHRANAKELLKQAAGHVSDTVYFRYHRMAIMEDVQEHLAKLNTESDDSLVKQTRA
jgi:integrase